MFGPCGISVVCQRFRGTCCLHHRCQIEECWEVVASYMKLAAFLTSVLMMETTCSSETFADVQNTSSNQYYLFSQSRENLLSLLRLTIGYLVSTDNTIIQSYSNISFWAEFWYNCLVDLLSVCHFTQLMVIFVIIT